MIAVSLLPFTLDNDKESQSDYLAAKFIRKS
jgi:hypothetical protein